jgi:signal peptidase I
MIRGVLTVVFDILQTIVLAAAIFVIIYLFAAQPHLVKGSSMEPNFHDGDYILTEKVSYKFREPKRGEVIIFKAPNRPDADYIKRVIGLPGETMKVIEGKIYINNTPLDEQYEPISSQTFSGRFLEENKEFTIPQNQYFVFGDNRSHSSDSREFGPVDKELIIGRALVRYWPVPRFGAIKTPFYQISYIPKASRLVFSFNHLSD